MWLSSLSEILKIHDRLILIPQAAWGNRGWKVEEVRGGSGAT